MARRLFAMLVAISLGGWALAANERATFVLTSGERVSGSVVFHGDNRENLISNYLNLAVDGEAKERTFPADQVAVIEFLGGTPPRSELAALPEGSGTHFLVMRNGESGPGHMVNMIGGDTLKWHDLTTNQTRDIPLRDVSRIYLNPENARRIYNYNGPRRGGANTAGGNANLQNVQTQPGEIEVQANVPWTDSGIAVRKGDQIAFSVRGQIAFGQGPTQTATADGNGSTKAATSPIPSLPVGAFIAKVGNSAPFPIGTNRNAITMPATGRLMLGVNDDNYSDNTGAYRVMITRR